MILPEVWALCLSLMDEQSCQLLPDLRQIKVRTQSDHGKPSFSSSLALWNGSLFLFMGIQMEKVA